MNNEHYICIKPITAFNIVTSQNVWFNINYFSMIKKVALNLSISLILVAGNILCC